jgi:hypothetical protein
MKNEQEQYTCIFCDRKLDEVGKMVLREDTGCAVCAECVFYAYEMLMKGKPDGQDGYLKASESKL